MAPRGFIGSGRLHIGRGSYVNYGYFVDPTAGVSLGENVRVGPQALMLTRSHEIGPSEARRTERQPDTDIHAPITVGDNVWIGARAVLLPGVNVGNGVVIAAGSVVTRDCLPNGLYAGAPARRVRDLPV